jgi:hypothetical protein
VALAHRVQDHRPQIRLGGGANARDLELVFNVDVRQRCREAADEGDDRVVIAASSIPLPLLWCFLRNCLADSEGTFNSQPGAVIYLPQR